MLNAPPPTCQCVPPRPLGHHMPTCAPSPPQAITLLWTMLTSGHELLGGVPLARRVIIVCPTSLVSNWDSECVKWLKVTAAVAVAAAVWL